MDGRRAKKYTEAKEATCENALSAHLVPPLTDHHDVSLITARISGK